MDAPHRLYVMIAKTDTGIGKVIRQVTGYPYNHVSLNLDGDFRRWISFARFHRNTPLYGGYITEPAERFLAKGETVDVRIFAIDLTPERHDELRKLFSKAGTPDSGYIYNYLELLTLSLGIPCPIRDAYSCLGFANAVMGTAYRSIRELDRQMVPYLFYEGALNDLAPDTGDRSDRYFTRLALGENLTCSIQTLGAMIRRIFTHDKEPTPV